MSKQRAIIAFTTDDLSDDEVSLLKEKLDSLVDEVVYRRLPVADAQVLVIRPKPKDVTFVWNEDMNGDDLQLLDGYLREVLPRCIVTNYEPSVESLNPEALGHFIRALQAELDADTATTAEQDAMEVLRESAHRFSKLRKLTPLQVVIEDTTPGEFASRWHVSFRAGDIVAWTWDVDTLQEAATLAAVEVEGIERFAAATLALNP